MRRSASELQVGGSVTHRVEEPLHLLISGLLQLFVGKKAGEGWLEGSAVGRRLDRREGGWVKKEGGKEVKTEDVRGLS